MSAVSCCCGQRLVHSWLHTLLKSGSILLAEVRSLRSKRIMSRGLTGVACSHFMDKWCFGMRPCIAGSSRLPAHVTQPVRRLCAKCGWAALAGNIASE